MRILEQAVLQGPTYYKKIISQLEEAEIAYLGYFIYDNFLDYMILVITYHYKGRGKEFKNSGG